MGAETNTASYDDNAKMLTHTLQGVRKQNPSVDFIFVIGDQQTYDRMVCLLSDCSDGRYDWLIPMPGEFHLLTHVV